jgi:hypothetical protein
VGTDRVELMLALETFSVLVSSKNDESSTRITALNVGGILVETMRVFSRTDREVTSLAASALARISDEKASTGLGYHLSPADARLCSSLLQDVDALLSSDGVTTIDLLDMLGGDMVSLVASKMSSSDAAVQVAGMLKNVMAQRMAEKLSTEEGTRGVVSYICTTIVKSYIDSFFFFFFYSFTHTHTHTHTHTQESIH